MKYYGLNLLKGITKQRRSRKEIQVGTFEKKKGFDPGTIRTVDGSDSRSDKELGTLCDEYGEQAMEGILAKPAKKSRLVE